MKKELISALVLLLLLCSCNKDETIFSDPEYPPVITLDSPSGVYEVKAGQKLTIVPQVENGEDALYYWIIDKDTVCRQSVYEAVFDNAGEIYLTLAVENRDGSDSEQMRIDVLALQPPVVSLPLPSQEVQALTGVVYTFRASVESSLPATFLWTCNGETAGTGQTYEFSSETTGVFEIVFSATNEDGTGCVRFRITVLETLPIKISFPVRSGFDNALRRSVALGRSLYLNPTVGNVSDPQYVWTVDGIDVCTDSVFVYTPSSEGETSVVLTVTEQNTEDTGIVGVKSAQAIIEVLCSQQSSVKREASALSSAEWDRVYEYTPAPGQFINESKSGYKDVLTMQQACDYADGRMKSERYVSLGAFGGYIIVGFDHSIENRGAHEGYDFSVKGNQFDTSSEPGIVWVMQDNNGNSLPDDEWYELAGSSTNVVRDYAVTYYRPSAVQSGVQWTDNKGGSGTVEYQSIFHNQDFYYPLWVGPDLYTLYGTRLEPNVYINPANKQWVMGPYDWGYADNFGQDMLSGDGNVQAGPAKTYFKIDNAVYSDGKPVKLDFIDFVKVQCGVLAQAGSLGEVSTEVLGFKDENLGK